MQWFFFFAGTLLQIPVFLQLTGLINELQPADSIRLIVFVPACSSLVQWCTRNREIYFLISVIFLCLFCFLVKHKFKQMKFNNPEHFLRWKAKWHFEAVMNTIRFFFLAYSIYNVLFEMLHKRAYKNGHLNITMSTWWWAKARLPRTF